MRQIFFFHGGSSYDSYDTYISNLKSMDLDYDRLKPKQRWREWITQQLPDDDILTPTMPNGYNAQFDEWSIYFEKMIPFFRENVQLVGHSLGAMFLTKYLQERPLAVPAKRIILVSPAYNDNSGGDSGSFLVSSCVDLVKSSLDIHLFHSEDDPVVPFAELDKFQHDLPSAQVHTFTDRGHFLDSTFPELLNLLKR